MDHGRRHSRGLPLNHLRDSRSNVFRLCKARCRLSRTSNTALTRNAGRYNGNGRDWATPPEVFDPLHAEFDFTLDACAAVVNAKLPRFYTEAQDGLAQSWAGERVFMNPPYGAEIYPWTRKARDSGALVVGLLPASCDLKWWHEDVVGKAEVRYIRGRVRFLTDRPDRRASGFFASVIVIWRAPWRK